MLLPGYGDQVMANPQQQFALDRNIVSEEQIVVFDDRSGQRILDRNHGRIHAAFSHCGENLRRQGAGKNGCLRENLQRRFVTE